MYFRIAVIGILMLCLLISKHASANQPLAKFELSALPNKCVALREGRTCFAKIALRFSVLKPGKYCIKQHGEDIVLYCEVIERYGLFNVDFQSKTTMAYTLIEQSTQLELASAIIDVAWVHHKTSKKRRWRIF